MKHKIKGDLFRWNSSVWDFDYLMKSIKKDEEIDLAINSVGGDAFVGIDICNTLKEHKGYVTITITGIAASAASVICMGADKIRAHKNTMMMVHNAQTFAMGDANKLRKAAENVEKVSQAVLNSYTNRVASDTMKKLLDDETYLTAEEALEYGLIDEIIDGDVEEVESEMFKNMAGEFNNKLNKEPETNPVHEEKLAQMFEDLKQELRNEFKNQYNNQQKEPDQEPVKNSNLGKLFLNLKN
ncbi:MAG: ATP-dependent Clp protease proteolytic subunit [Bacillaceae bacterium]|nr:ATP-dependent Clp protease proteolytic subunit [Bacillaceae bacterium]